MTTPLLRRVAPSALPGPKSRGVDPATLDAVRPIIEAVERDGEAALRSYAERFGDLAPGEPLVRMPQDLQRALDELPAEDRGVLERTAARIRAFAEAQRRALSELTVPIPGGSAGHLVAPLERAGCYAPGGRFPLPSSVLMTTIPARVAGVGEVWVASPKPTRVTLAAAALAGANGLLAVGGAQAIAALAFGAGPIPPSDIVVGPGNRWVTAAKALLVGRVAIDFLAGPSELLVLADSGADADRVAADLLAQAEHDVDAIPILVTFEERFAAEVDRALEARLEALPAAEVARTALANGFAVLCPDVESAISACDHLAPEHLELMIEDAPAIAPRLRHYGALFIGSGSAEVLGDYGAGPNHVLPTGGAARSSGGLSVLSFLRVRTWLSVDATTSEAGELIDDAARLARLEGLEAHARSAETRRPKKHG